MFNDDVDDDDDDDAVDAQSHANMIQLYVTNIVT